MAIVITPDIEVRARIWAVQQAIGTARLDLQSLPVTQVFVWSRDGRKLYRLPERITDWIRVGGPVPTGAIRLAKVK